MSAITAETVTEHFGRQVRTAVASTSNGEITCPARWESGQAKVEGDWPGGTLVYAVVFYGESGERLFWWGGETRPVTVQAGNSFSVRPEVSAV